jgi:hypothetical protein
MFWLSLFNPVESYQSFVGKFCSHLEDRSKPSRESGLDSENCKIQEE